jgi:N-carbamoylputrescine amidase
LAVGVVAAVRSGAFSLSSNRVDPTGGCGGSGWIIDPAGEVLAITSAGEPFATREIDLVQAAAAQQSYPRYVFAGSSVASSRVTKLQIAAQPGDGAVRGLEPDIERLG